MTGYTRYTGMLAVIIVGVLIFSTLAFSRQPYPGEELNSYIESECASMVNYVGLALLRIRDSGARTLPQMIDRANKNLAHTPKYYRDASLAYLNAVWSHKDEANATDGMWQACIRYTRESLDKENI